MIDFIASHAGIIGLVFFVSFFIGVLVWLYRPGAKKDFEKHGNIPLEEKDGKNEQR